MSLYSVISDCRTTVGSMEPLIWGITTPLTVRVLDVPASIATLPTMSVMLIVAAL
jgi:hypothetical protein